MPVPIAVAIRKQIVERHEAGQSLAHIARSLEMAYESVRKVWRVYRLEGRVEPRYDRCGKRGVRGSKRVYRAAMMLKRRHPTWGAGVIGQVIYKKWGEEARVTQRTMQRWFKQGGIHTPRNQPRGEARQGRPREVHEVWAMDSRDGISLADGSKAVWLIVSDEASGSILHGSVFPPESRQSSEGGHGE